MIKNVALLHPAPKVDPIKGIASFTAQVIITHHLDHIWNGYVPVLAVPPPPPCTHPIIHTLHAFPFFKYPYLYLHLSTPTKPIFLITYLFHQPFPNQFLTLPLIIHSTHEQDQYFVNHFLSLLMAPPNTNPFAHGYFHFTTSPVCFHHAWTHMYLSPQVIPLINLHTHHIPSTPTSMFIFPFFSMPLNQYLSLPSYHCSLSVTLPSFYYGVQWFMLTGLFCKLRDYLKHSQGFSRSDYFQLLGVSVPMNEEIVWMYQPELKSITGHGTRSTFS